MAKTPAKIMRPFASWFVSAYFVAVAVYSFVMAFLYDPLCIPLYVQAGFAIISGAGVFMLKRWSLWLSAIALPVIFVVELSALNFSRSFGGFNPNWGNMAINLSYLAIMILAVFSSLLLIDKRRELK